MAECRDLENLFAAYVDGEAAPGDCAALDAHLRDCPCCRECVAEERAAREAVVARRGMFRACASGELRKRCEAHCRGPVVHGGLASGGGVFSKRGWMRLSMAATLVLAVTGVFVYGLRDNVSALGAQLAADHVKCFEFATPPTVIPDPMALGRKWAEDRGWAVKVPGSEPEEQLEFLDIRRCISTSGLTAHLMYKWRGQPLSVYVLNSSHPRVGSVPRLVEKFGQEEIIWSQRGRTYAVVARGRPVDVEHVALYVQRMAE